MEGYIKKEIVIVLCWHLFIYFKESDFCCVLQAPVIDDDEEQVEEEVPETRIEVEIPRIMTNLGKILHYVKLPNFLSVETR